MLQAFGAGYVESFLTYDVMYKHWYNTLHDFCGVRRELCRKVQDHLDRNLIWVNDMITNQSNTEPYWHQVNLFYEQLKGLEYGYRIARELDREASKNLTFSDLLWLNVQGDLEDLFSALETGSDEPTSVRGAHLPGSTSCSALIKLLPDSSDLFTSHDTWSSFQSMLRVQKRYIFPYKVLPQSNSTVPGHVITFSSYPGTIQSGDDFYVTSAGLVTLETTTGNSNHSLWQYVKAEGQVLEQVRTMVANRLGHCGMSWSKAFTLYNSGTYNNQWMVVDYKRFKKGTPQHLLRDKLLWVLEQLPGYIRAEDKTQVLRQQSYWPSYNTPYFPDIYSMSGQGELAAKYGDWFTYDRTPRALMFRRDHVKVNDTSSMIALMRYNDYLHDPLSRCNCTPPYSGENAIACRNDVNPINGTYPFPALGHRSHTATDMKLTTADLVTKLQFIAIAGPPYNNYLPPFQWSTSDYKNLPHLGHPDVFKFEPVLFKWKW
ncbi:putative phospholipase B-like 2 isoform X2 [Zootermopsis nevadensis]|nr:putative phospholipase B-like 2 isoform X2 [Zootermopsis nevadensis]